MVKRNGAGGSTLVLVLALFGVILLAVAFFAINFYQTLGTQVEAQTAIDAAALQAAKDMGQVVINGNFGKVALVDDVPPNNDYTERNILGINTILATIRLDLIIANKLGNTSMIYAARGQLARAAADADALTKAIKDAAAGTAAASDKNGYSIDIQTDVLNAYNNNSRRMGNTNKALVAGSLKITVGQLAPGAGSTNTPTPKPADDDSTTQNSTYAANGFYKPYVAVPTPGSDITITFVSVGNQPALAPNNSFVSNLPSGVAPAVVQVSADEAVAALAPGSSGQKLSSTVHVASTAQCGGQRYTMPSGGLYIAFPDGFPSGNGVSVDFSSVKSFINSSMLPSDASADTKSPFTGWSGQDSATYSVNSGSGNLSAQAYMGRQGDDPAVALSLMTSNWLFSLGLRPDIESVTNALSTNLHSFGDKQQPGDSTTISADFNRLHQFDSVAETSGPPVTVPYVCTIDPVTGKDRRRLADNNRPENNMRMLEGFMQEGPQAIGLLSRAPILHIDSHGHIASDAPLVVQRQIIQDNNLAGAAHDSALTVINAHAPVFKSLFQTLAAAEPSLNDKKTSAAELAGTLSKVAQKSEVLAEAKAQLDREARILKRAQAVRSNSMKIARLTDWMLNNYSRLSGPECKVILAGHVSSLTGLTVHHLHVAPTAEDIVSGGNLLTGQDTNDDWSSPKLSYVMGRTVDIIAKAKPDKTTIVPPALAQSSIRAPQKYQFYFTLQGDAQSPDQTGSGQVLLTLAPYGTASPRGPLPGQMVYQNPLAIDTPYDFVYLDFDAGMVAHPKTTQDFMRIDWQAIGWNNDSYFSTSSSYYNNDNNDNNEGTPATTGAPAAVKPVVAFWLRCPTGRCTSPVYKVFHPGGNFIAWDIFSPGNIAPRFNATVPWGNDNAIQLMNWEWYWHTVSQDQIDQMNKELQMVQQGGCEIIPETII